MKKILTCGLAFIIGFGFASTVSADAPPTVMEDTQTNKGNESRQAEVQTVAEGNYSYEVMPGDTLWSLAETFNTTVEAIKFVNNMNSDLIIIGEVITIPVTANIIIQPGDTLSELSLEFGKTIEQLTQWNHIEDHNLIIAGDILTIFEVDLEVLQNERVVYHYQTVTNEKTTVHTETSVDADNYIDANEASVDTNNDTKQEVDTNNDNEEQSNANTDVETDTSVDTDTEVDTDTKVDTDVETDVDVDTPAIDPGEKDKGKGPKGNNGHGNDGEPSQGEVDNGDGFDPSNPGNSDGTNNGKQKEAGN